MNDRKKVLFVDDEAPVRHLVARWLQGEGYEALLAGDRHEGLEFLRAYSPDVVVVDHTMPGMNGVEFARQARHTERFEGPMYLASGNFQYEKHKFPDADSLFTGYLDKPFSKAQLLALISPRPIQHESP